MSISYTGGEESVEQAVTRSSTLPEDSNEGTLRPKNDFRIYRTNKG